MRKSEISLKIEPDINDFEEIYRWLKEEYDDRGEGFYSNIEFIKEAYHMGDLIVFKCGRKSIGFVIWSKDTIYVNIDIFVINPHYRGQGYGSIFYDAILEYFINGEFLAMKLFCAPPSSEHFWRKMGLKRLPKCELGEHELTYYEILVETASDSYIKNADKIELWDVDFYNAEGIAPKWVWYVELEKGDLVYPIIHPCNCNWKLRWSRKGQVIKEEKVKYFTDECQELFYSPFLCINILEE